MNVQYAHTPYFTSTLDSTPSGRIIVGIVLHDTETAISVNPRQEGSWHYEIDRDGTIYQFVDEADIAWHVRACDRWWPDWLPDWGDYAVSRMNEWSVGIELVSDASYRAAGEPYTRAQYVAVTDLVRDIFSRHGELPIVGHGQVQADRSDPVQFNWDAFHRLLAETPEEEDEMARLTDEQRDILDKMADLAADASSIDDWLSKLGEYENHTIPALREEVTSLTERLTNADLRTGSDIGSVAVTRRDGRVEVLQ